MLRKLLMALGALPLLLLPWGSPLAQAISRLPVNLDDPDIVRFSREKLRPQFTQPRLPPLEIPVLNFVKPVSKALRFGPGSAGCRQAITSDADRGWYAIQHTCPQLIINIMADRRVQSAVDAPAPERVNQPVVIEPASGDAQDERGLIGNIIMYRYPNIPYHISVECTETSKDICTSESALRALLENIALVAVPARR